MALPPPRRPRSRRRCRCLPGLAGAPLISAFLAVLSMIVLAVYLRQRGSPESKPVGAGHAATGVES
ncbi:DUF6766 family protein [Nonomuraea sp. NPDC059007]|uniref:DUF6766 family protein n=1 Tax=Nonomuraea sp. NPDC059007 TaxID=3346692 RepID=UPI0036B5AFCE